jgi:hypothetical protein
MSLWLVDEFKRLSPKGRKAVGETEDLRVGYQFRQKMKLSTLPRVFTNASPIDSAEGRHRARPVAALASPRGTLAVCTPDHA